MILHLTILNGTHAGHSVQVTAGTPRTFGRAAQSDVVLQDVYLSDVHFALYCDEQGARVRDLQSHNGTFVNNAPVTDATLAAGDRISAGQTVFEVAITAHGLEAPASALSTTGEITAEDLVRGMQSAPHDCARWALHSEEGNYFAIIDCAREPDLITLVNRIHEEFCAFDETREPDDLGETAPFLVTLTARGMAIHDRVLSLSAGAESGFESDGKVGFDPQGFGVQVTKIEFKGITLKGRATVISLFDVDVDYKVMQKRKVGGPLRFPG